MQMTLSFNTLYIMVMFPSTVLCDTQFSEHEVMRISRDTLLTVGLNVFLQVPLLLGRVYAGQVHPVEAAILLGLVPVRLRKKK